MTFDGCVSALRTYEPFEINRLLNKVEGADDYEWRFTTSTFPLPKVTCYGIPKKRKLKKSD